MLYSQLERFAAGPLCRTVSGLQKCTTSAQLKNTEESATVSLENARAFEDIPGPGGLKFLRNCIPGGAYYKKSITEMVMLLEKQYGTTFRMPGLFGKPPIIMAMDPVDFGTIFRNEGQWPDRRNFESLEYYRKVYRRDMFEGNEGILFSSGERWAKGRTAVNPILMQPKNVVHYLDTMLDVNDEFLTRIREIRDPVTQEMPETFVDDIKRLTFETVAAVALNTQLGIIRKNRDSPEAKIIMDSIQKFFDLAYDLDIMPSVWKYVKTPKFWEMMHTADALTDICTKYVNEAVARNEQESEAGLSQAGTGKEKSVLEKLLRIDKQFAIVMALDMMLAGVDTTSSTIAGLLLCIAKNPEKQAKLLAELEGILPQKDTRLTIESMRNMPYLRACIKESMRMYPLTPGTMRRMQNDVVIGGYRVPKGMEVVIGFNLLLGHEQYVPRANEFLPERWLRDSADGRKLEGAITNPYMFLPFGFGPRSCVGKRIVDMEMEIALARLVRNFQIEFNYSADNPFKAKFINIPAIPLKFKFEERRG